MQENLEPDTVTVVIRHHVRSGAQAQYLEWLKRIIPVAARFPGHRGVNVLPPGAEGVFYTITIRFDTLVQAQDWLGSSIRQAMMGQAMGMLEHAEEVQTVTGLEFWFTPEAAAKHARPFKQFLVTLSVIYPLTLVLPWLLTPLVERVPLLQHQAVSGLVIAAAIVGLMTYVVMPRYTKLVRTWLFE